MRKQRPLRRTQEVQLVRADDQPAAAEGQGRRRTSRRSRVATVYREIEAGRLHAIRVGAGRGTLRIPRPAYDAYVSSAGTAPAAEAA
jgi:hypothetical protein